MRLASVAALVAVAALAHAEEPQTTLRIATERLPNGLDVVLAPDRSVGSVVVHVRYEGGAAACP